MKTKIHTNRFKTLTQIASLGTLTLALGGVGCASKESTPQTNSQMHTSTGMGSHASDSQSRAYSQDNNRFTGPAGPRGETGPAGEAGYAGATGATGSGTVGATGARGADGPQGPRGPAGAAGPAGDVVRGAAGEAGSVGAAGERGATGRVGETGASVAGAAGATGATGSAGRAGVAGETGAQGPTTVGPTGQTGERGYAGAAGTSGARGERGATGAGAAGAIGATGQAGGRGEAGVEGTMGEAGVIGEWTSYRSIWFESNANSLHAEDRDLVTQITEYLQGNPSLRIGIDTTNPNGSGDSAQRLRSQRVNTVREALLQAGIHSNQIETGTYGDPQLARENQVRLVLRTAR